MNDEKIVTSFSKNEILSLLMDAFIAGTTSYHELAENVCVEMLEDFLIKKLEKNANISLEIASENLKKQDNRLNLIRDIQNAAIDNTSNIFLSGNVTVIGNGTAISSPSYSTTGNSGFAPISTSLFDTQYDIGYNLNRNRDSR